MQEDVYQGDGLNLYAYCSNNPVVYYDPSGYKKGSNSGCPPASNNGGDGGAPEGNESGTPSKQKTYQTYTKKNPVTGEVYSGRTSGYGTPAENVRRRDANHHMNEKGYLPAQLDQTSTNYNAIRGREQMLIDANGHAQSVGGTSGNAINGIGPNNKKKEIYINAAKELFGEIK